MSVADQRRAKSICEQGKTVNIAGREKFMYYFKLSSKNDQGHADKVKNCL